MAMGSTVRMWRWRRSPLRRRTDVVEAWAGLACGLLLAAGAPFTGASAAQGMHDSLSAQNHGRHLVAAVLDTDARSGAPSQSSESGPAEVRVPVTWHDHDGTAHTARVAVEPGGHAGSTTPVWVDGAGHVTDPPLDRLQTEVQSDVIGAGAAGGFCLAVLGAHRLLRFDLDRHRSRGWEREWARVGPQWSRGRRR